MKRVLLLVFILCIVYDGFSQAGMWTWIKGDTSSHSLGAFGVQGIPSSLNTPPGLYEAAEWTDKSGNFWLFGGYGSFDYADLWKYNPQSNEWTWMKGSSGPDDSGSYGIKGVSSINNRPSARGWGCSTWTDLNGDLWLYGGVNSRTSFIYSDLWRYNIPTNTWTWIQGADTSKEKTVYGTMGIMAPSNTPGARHECSATWVDGGNNLWLFGGYGDVGSRNDLWKYNIPSNQWTWMKGSNNSNHSGSYGQIGVPSSTNVPSTRGAFCSWKDINGKFWLHGGLRYDIDASFNDMWRYDPNSNNWTWMAGSKLPNDYGSFDVFCVSSPNYSPVSRYENRARWTDACGNFWFYGGIQGNLDEFEFDDLWYFNTQSLSWTYMDGGYAYHASPVYGVKEVTATDNSPGTRGGSVGWSSGGLLYLFGGSVNGWPRPYNDLWKFSVDTNCIGIQFCKEDCKAQAISIIKNNDTLSSFGAAFYQWYLNGSKIIGATNAVYVAIEPGYYTLEITDANGCIAMSEPVLISALNEIENEIVSIYPNPSVTGFQLSVASGLVGSNLEMYDANGRVVFLTTINQHQTTIAPILSPGVYFVRISSETASVVKRFVRL